ncbi:hypothetical protein SBFV2_gp37 [Sulfolobales Beppu filamentous virus 2]|uniref:Uncharacterized protein n=1 Tax=Sulfolobales Beppu filamentous virus 2 TaxID=2493123 RepID=A0A3Q8Q9T4_9VIRU|nr:hypothetical protein HOU84_gp37 [Sulfolobales Beppu filamentous virus 2]AZI75804.1 hypothetical protein SBFV2_gp37 [Sulfolobales Beppu filamentous virus 2]
MSSGSEQTLIDELTLILQEAEEEKKKKIIRLFIRLRKLLS